MRFEHFDRWKVSAFHNRPFLRLVPRTNRDLMQALLHPIEHRNRVNLWILMAGLLDAARYLNLSRFDSDLHSYNDGNWKERAIWTELSFSVMRDHETAMTNFRVSMKAETDNFADVLGIKLALYEAVMRIPNGAPISPVYLLADVTRQHYAKKRAATA